MGPEYLRHEKQDFSFHMMISKTQQVSGQNNFKGFHTHDNWATNKKIQILTEKSG